MKHTNFYDKLSIIPDLYNPHFLENLKKELEEEYYINIKNLDSMTLDSLINDPFKITYDLLTLYNYPICNYDIYDDLKVQCIVSSLYTYHSLINSEIKTLSKTILDGYSPEISSKSENIIEESNANEKNINDYETDSSTAIRQFDKLIKTNFKYLINFSIKKKTKLYYRNLQFFLPKLFDIFTYNVSNKTYYKLYKYINNQPRFSQYFRRGITSLFSDYSTLFNRCITEDINENPIYNILYYYKIENSFHVSLIFNNLNELLKDNIQVEKIRTLSNLPNVFSRNTWKEKIDNSNHIKYLSNFLIPLYQKLFFFIFYNYACNDILNNAEKKETDKQKSITDRLESYLNGGTEDIICFLKDEKSKFSFSKQDISCPCITYTYEYYAAVNISILLKTLYVDKLNTSYSFPECSSQKLVTLIYYLAKLPSKYDYDPIFYRFNYNDIFNRVNLLFPNYANFLIFKKIAAVSQSPFRFPVSKDPNINLVKNYLSDLVYCSLLIVFSHNKIFINTFISIFNFTFEFLPECEGYNNLFGRYLTVKKISIEDFSEKKIEIKIHSSLYYFVTAIFESDIKNMGYEYLPSEFRFSLENSQYNLTSLILSIEEELNNLPLS